MNILLFGPQGSGKGTQGEKLAERYHIPLIGTGALLREESKKETERGHFVLERMKSGKLVPDDITNAVLFDRLHAPDTADGFIFDGYPRNIAQKTVLQNFLFTFRGGTKITQVIVLELSDDEAVARLSGRRTCAGCGEIYHVENRPPAKEGVCDKCGGELVQRTDDTPEAIRKRLAIYHADTAPLLADYERDGVVVRIDARGAIDEVQKRIVQAIEGG